ncbi:unnamed protein product [Closterium sp. Naga37s-1]|nr:unnamed protein product [Closterium sp. Naga37s-1]
MIGLAVCQVSGTGKTSMIRLSVCQVVDTSSRETQALILSPTRELAVQTEKTVLAVGDFMNVQAYACIGGRSIGEDIRKLEFGVQVRLEFGVQVRLEFGVQVRLEFGVQVRLEFGVQVRLEFGVQVRLALRCMCGARPRCRCDEEARGRFSGAQVGSHTRDFMNLQAYSCIGGRSIDQDIPQAQIWCSGATRICAAAAGNPPCAGE